MENGSSNVNVDLISKCIGFHGQPLQKIWEGEHGEKDLTNLGVVNPDFSAYQARQKYFTFQDRAKRLKLHQFIAKKANMLFSQNLIHEHVPSFIQDGAFEEICTMTAPLEHFLSEKIDKVEKLRHILKLLKPGDIVYGTIYSKSVSGMIVKLHCTGGPVVRFLSDFNARAFLPNSETIPAIDRKGTTRNYITYDCVCCEIIDIIMEKIVIGMKGEMNNDTKIPFGLIGSENFPEIYKLFLEKNEPYLSYLESSANFENTNSLDYLANIVGLDTSHYYSNMSGLRGKFPSQEYGSELRQVQACKWAFRSVAEGIEHFKEGRHSEAFQCLNKALSIDPRNVEGLVARGALYANNGSFKKAVDDFETALKLNANHANARKYMGETLVALGRSYEEENKIEEAKKAYQDCLNIIPHHEEAKNSLEFLWSKTNGSGAAKQLIEPNELTLPALNIKIAEQNRDAGGTSKKEKDKKKKKKSKNRKRRSSSSTSSSESSDSSNSSSASSSSTESTSSTDSEQSSKHKKKRKSKSDKGRPKSLSPLSKRMALMKGDEASSSSGYNFGQTAYMVGEQQPDEYELRVRKFLELTRDEENYEEKVRKFVEEADKYRKDRKISEEKAKKREKKKNRKMKKDSKKKKKEKKSKSSKKDKDELADIENMEFREALKIFKNLPVFDFNSKIDSDAVEKALFKEENREKKKQEEPQKDENKWKMMFTKDDRKTNLAVNTASTSSATLTKATTKQYSFPNEDDADQFRGTKDSGSQKSEEKKDKKRPPTPPPPISIRGGKYAEAPPPPKAPVGPVVLDKFGNFRLASTERPPEPPAPPRRSRSRSHSRRRYSSDSRSRSRSAKRRSRSRSYGRRRSRSRSYRSRSASRSRSYSRSRSRSRSVDRRRRYGMRGNYDRGTYYKPRFNNQQRYGYRGGRGGYRDYRDFRGRGRDRFRGGWVNRGGGGNYRHRRDDSRDRRMDRRSRSASHDSDDRRSPRASRGKHSDNETERGNSKGQRKSPPPPPSSSDVKEENWDDEARHTHDAPKDTGNDSNNE